MNMKNTRIRIIYYTSSITVILLLVLIINAVYLNSYRSEFDLLSDHLYENAVESKKVHLEIIVKSTIHLIESDYQRTLQQLGHELNEDELYAITERYMRDYIHSIELPDNGYIWVNQIVNYDGGDDYAIRLIHPNLPHTEGSLLSTNTLDQDGNKPYQTELDGINEQGELYFQYYFKELNSEQVSHKMSYAKLYRPFDWVVATGVHLDDIDTLIANERIAFEASYNQICNRAFLISAVSLILSLIIILVFENQINSLFTSYTDILEERNISLHRDKVKIEEIANLDALTQLPNRRYLVGYLDDEIAHAEHTNKSFTIALCDIDFFKNVNDNFGHNAGDAVLKEIAHLLSNNVRRTDLVGRWGGEEFVILLRHTDLETAFTVIEKIRTAIESHTFNYDSIDIKCTGSFGISKYDKNSNTAQILISQADEAMYLAKSTGRNKTVIFDAQSS